MRSFRKPTSFRHTIHTLFCKRMFSNVDVCVDVDDMDTGRVRDQLTFDDFGSGSVNCVSWEGLLSESNGACYIPECPNMRLYHPYAQGAAPRINIH